jgi:hypothetical protein
MRCQKVGIDHVQEPLTSGILSILCAPIDLDPLDSRLKILNKSPGLI